MQEPFPNRHGKLWSLAVIAFDISGDQRVSAFGRRQSSGFSSHVADSPRFSNGRHIDAADADGWTEGGKVAEPRCGSGRGRRATRTPAGGGGSEGVRPGFSSCVGSAMKVFAGKQPRLKSDDSSDLLGFGWSDRLASPAPPPSPATYSLSRETRFKELRLLDFNAR